MVGRHIFPMSEQSSDLEQTLALVLKLSPAEKAHLIEQLAVTLEHDLALNQKKPKRSLYGLWADVSVSAEDIDEARREMWSNFPREDI